MKKTWLYPLVIVLFLNLAMAGVVAASGPTQSGNGALRVSIVKPAQNGVVSIGDVPVQVKAENLPPNATYKWQFYVDGLAAGTASANIVSYTVQITVSGPHSIKAALADAQSKELASAEVNVTAAPRTPNVAFNVSEMGPVMAVLTLGIFLLVILSLRLTSRPHS